MTHNPFVYVVPAGDAGIPLRKVLRDRMGLSRTLVVRLKQAERGILLNGQRAFTSARVQLGDRVEICLPQDPPGNIVPEPIAFEILYEDEHLLAVNKPAGLIVHPTHGHYSGTLANGVVHYWQEQGLSLLFRPVHRLDQDTSGVLVIAKHAYAHQKIAEQLQKNRVDKQYVAFVYGKPEPVAGTVDGPIGRSTDNPHVRIVRPDGAPSLTRYETVETFGTAAALLRVSPITGRTHQIRVHLRHIGHPIVGDPMYATDCPPLPGAAINRQALHASALRFAHPISGEPMQLEAPWPQDLQDLRNLLLANNVERMNSQ